jgi:ornithine cyclodeaminase/alanine dehydrogenase-like protein (mu-crystallin family)
VPHCDSDGARAPTDRELAQRRGARAGAGIPPGPRAGLYRADHVARLAWSRSAISSAARRGAARRLFKSTGMVWEDAVIAAAVYERSASERR